MIEINNIYNMDCLEGMDMMIKQGIKVDAVITDIPYGTTQCKWDSIIPFDEMWERLFKIRQDTTPIILFGNEPFSSSLRLSNIKEYKYDWIWKKNIPRGHLNAKRMPMRTYELISVFYKKPPLYNPQMVDRERPVSVKDYGKNSVYGKTSGEYARTYDKKYPVDILKFDSIQNGKHKVHPTQKPIDLIEYLINTYTNEGDTVLDFTIGSGTTAVACINTNRNYIGFELDASYFNIAKQRIEEVKNGSNTSLQN